ncbi:MAG: right-handed parallel beta-helix repeat-containing protein, partial [candidate division WOR-3 bacterium]|nr:right-handed parallel beta-helix repeat-containing protein [candidate division WOR-3 bacterium]
MKKSNKKTVLLLIMIIIAYALYPAVFYVDTLGTDDSAHGIGPGTDAYRTIGYAISNVSSGDSIMVAPGAYPEALTVDKSIWLLGPNEDKIGYDGDRAEEAVVSRSANGVNVITVSADNVTVSGFTIDGNDNGTGDKGIANDFTAPVNNLTVKNNIIRDLLEQGIHLDGPGTAGSGNLISGNYIVNIINEPGEWQMTTNHSITGRGVVLQNDIYADIRNNVMEDLFSGIYTRTFSSADTCRIDSNTISVNANNTTDGSWFTPEVPSKPGLGITNYQHSGSSYFYVSYNNIKKYNSVADSYCNGISCLEIYDNAGIYYYHNTIDEMASAYSLFDCPTSNTVTIRGCEMGMDTSKNSIGVGINLSNVIADDMGFTGPNYSYAQNSQFNIDSVTIQYAKRWGIYQFGQDNATPGDLHMELTNSTVELTRTYESDNANINIFNVNRDECTANITNCIIRNSGNRGINIVGNGLMQIMSCRVHDNSSYGIMLRNRENAAANIINNKIYNNSVHVNLDYETTTNTTNLFNNSFTGSGLAVRNYRNVAIDTVNAYCNWFESNTEAGVTGSFRNMSGYIDYSPWLHDSTNTASMGFASDMMGLHVSYSSLNVSDEGFVSEAMNYLADSGTVYLKDGLYAETVVIDKNCTFDNGGTSNIDRIDLLTNNTTLNLAGNLTVNDSIICDSACINTGADTLMLGSSAMISGENDSGHIDGFVSASKPVGTGASAMGNIGVDIASGADDLGAVSIVRESGSGTEVSIQTISKKWHISSDNPPASGRDITFNWLTNDDNSINQSNLYLMSSPDNSSPESYSPQAGPFDA